MFQMLGFERKCSFDVDGDGADFSMSRSIDPKCASQKKGKGKGGSGGLRSWGEDLWSVECLPWDGRHC